MKPPSNQWEIMPLFSTPLYLAQDIITPEILQQVKDLDYIDQFKEALSEIIKDLVYTLASLSIK